MATTKLILRPDLVKKDKGKPTTIYVAYCFNGLTKRYSTGQKIEFDFWNDKEQTVKKSYPDKKKRDSINSIVQAEQAKVDNIISKAQFNNIEPSFEYVQKQIDLLNPEKSDKSKDFLILFESFIETRKADPEYSVNTIKHYRTSLKHLRNFCVAQKYKISFDKIDNKFYDVYKKYLYNLQMQPNTVGNEIKYLKTFLNWATDHGYNNNLAFKKFTKPKEKTIITVLTQAELEVLFNCDLKDNSRLERVRDLFLLGCYTGLRFSDLSNLRPESVRGNFIELRTIKTKDPLKIPIAPQARLIIEKYEGNLPKISNQKANEYLKELGKKVGLDNKANRVKYIGGKRVEIAVNKFELITTHTARRTFITLALKQGMPQVTLIKITGHKDLRTMQKYVDITEEDTYNAMMKIFSYGEQSLMKV